MPKQLHILLVANGQGLSVESAPKVVAGALVDRLIFDVRLSSHWDGFTSYSVVLRRSGGLVRACSIVDGKAVADREALAGSGALEVAVEARDGERRLTSSLVVIQLENSGI